MLEVNSYYSTAYGYENREGKLLLKLWKYSIDTHIASTHDFDKYKRTFLITDVVSLIKGYCIDISDIGTVEECIDLVVAVNKRRSIIV